MVKQCKWQSKLDSVAVHLGLVGNIALSFLFFPVTRGSSILPLFGLTSEASIKYHIWLGHIVMTLFTAHGICYIIYWIATDQVSQMVKWKHTGISNLAGEISLLAGLVLWATTFPSIRRKTFEVFYYTHHLYILFVIFFVMHVGISYATLMLPGLFLFMVDRLLRFLQSGGGVHLICARVLPCETVELTFSKHTGLSYTPTSIMFINIPRISKLQWHPFSVISSSSLESDKLSILVKGEGSWSTKLCQLFASPTSVDYVKAYVEGPYGPVSTDMSRHDILVMVSGGSGVTPFISIIRELIYMSETLKCKTPKILLVASFRNSTHLSMLDVILPISGAPSEFANLELQIEAYITREEQPSMQEKVPIRTVYFKPDPDDAPITPILGKNNWLWLAAIISSSFVIYLILIGILTRFYIYPIDHNTNKIFSSAARSVLHILFLCICILITGTTAFLLNKNMAPTDHAASSICNADRELESLPQQSLSQSINVHYGARPNLTRILSKRTESSVGVVVCGPKTMRHKVAKICSTGLSANLHFESISFSW